jgi:dihydroflavonol-4-reductase
MTEASSDSKLPPTDSACLVTGATGFTGRHLVKLLCAQGCRVTALARPSSERGNLVDLPIRWVTGEVFDAEAIAEAVRGQHYIFHLAAAYRKQEGGRDYYAQVHVESTRLLLQSAAREPDFRRFVHVSTVGVHGHVETPPATEESPYSPGDIYQETKLEGELLTRLLAPELKVSFAVIRPVGIFGPEDERLLKFFKSALWPVCPLLGWKACLYHLIRGEDLARAIALAGVHPNAEGEVFIAGNREATSLKEMATVAAEALGHKVRFLRLPASPFFAAAWLCEKLFGLIGKAPPLHPRRIAFYTKDRSFDTSKIHDRLGFNESLSTRESIAATARAYRAAGRL